VTVPDVSGDTAAVERLLEVIEAGGEFLLSDYPGLVVRPGVYPCVVEHPNGQRLAAELDLLAGRDPEGHVFNWPVEEHGCLRALPRPAEQLPLVKCDLRAG